MSYLLDTHVFLWFVLNDGRLSSDALALLRATDARLFLSMASLWEIGIKHSSGKMPLPEPVEEFLCQEIGNNGIAILNMKEAHVFETMRLPFHHRDPFDRMILAQSVVENLPILSADATFDSYPIRHIW